MHSSKCSMTCFFQGYRFVTEGTKRPAFYFSLFLAASPPSFCELSLSLILLLRWFSQENSCVFLCCIYSDSHCSEKFSALSDAAGANLKSSSESHLVSATKSQMVQGYRLMQSRGDCSQLPFPF